MTPVSLASIATTAAATPATKATEKRATEYTEYTEYRERPRSKDSSRPSVQIRSKPPLIQKIGSVPHGDSRNSSAATIDARGGRPHPTARRATSAAHATCRTSDAAA